MSALRHVSLLGSLHEQDVVGSLETGDERRAMLEGLNRVALVELGSILAFANAEVSAHFVSSDHIDVHAFSNRGVGTPPVSDFKR